MIWSVDNIEWNIPCQIERTAEMTASDISGVLLDKTYFNDVLGTYMKYDIKIAVPFGMEDEYTELYELLTQPVDAHVFVLPYNQSTITLTARVASISDQYVYVDGRKNYWKGFGFSLIANHPSKEMSLNEAISRGTTQEPPFVNIPDGATFQWDAQNNAWIRLS